MLAGLPTPPSRMSFDFDAAVTVPLRMQPGLRRPSPQAASFTPIAPGSRHQREKLAVLSAFADDALCAVDDFDAGPAVDALCREAQRQRPDAWHWDGDRAQARWLGTACDRAGRVEQTEPGVFGLGDEVARCLRARPAHWRLAGLACLAFAEDFAVVDRATGTLPWLAVCLPTHWAPRDKVGRSFAEVHGPVADNSLIVGAADALVALVTGGDRWERFVWTVTPHPRLHAHPARLDPRGWALTAVADAWWRTERQGFLPVDAGAGRQQALFTIHVAVTRLADAAARSDRARRLHDAIASATPAVLAYRDLAGVREPLLAWLASRAGDRTAHEAAPTHDAAPPSG